MYYLITRWRQQQQIRQQDLFSEQVVSDYLFSKDRLFAEKTLAGAELELYDHFATALGETAPVPELLVYLSAPIETLMQRIASRGAAGEERIEPEYLIDLAMRYDRLLDGWDKCPVLRIDNRDMDYVNDPADRRAVLALIQQALAGQAADGAPGSADVDREAQPSLFGPEA